MSARIFLLRLACLLTLAVWLGGFTFYSGIVIPVLHHVMATRDAGQITQRVTIDLNEIGVGALASWWVLALVEGRAGFSRAARARLVLLAASSALLVFLLVMHRVMDRQLDTGSLAGFYPMHRAYLIASTAQWVVNLGILAATVWIWGAQTGARSEEE